MNGKRILVPVNLERNSFDGLEFISGLAGEMPIVATLLYVVNLNVSPVDRRINDELCHENERRLREIAKAFFKDQFPYLRVRVGKPDAEIVAEAVEGRSELIVMASSKTPRGKWRFRSSTVERVVGDAPCLTLVLPRNWKLTPEQYRQAMCPAAVPVQEPGAWS